MVLTLSSRRRRGTLSLITTASILLYVTWTSVSVAVFHRRQNTADYPHAMASSLRRAKEVQENAFYTPKNDQAVRRQLMLPGSMTYTSECRSQYLYNDTWGHVRSPYADKLHVKSILQSLNVTSLKTAETYALFQPTYLNKLTVKGLRERMDPLCGDRDCIIKPSHTSGAVARVANGTYSCFKKCRFPAANIPLPQGYKYMLQNMRISVKEFDSNSPYELNVRRQQMQYHYIPKQILVEEHLDLSSLKEWHWWVVHGQVMFGCLRCGGQGSYFSTQFDSLQMSQGLLPCEHPPAQRPRTWSKMIAVVSELAKHIPEGVTRIDLYADDEDTIYFSEFTFTSTGCTSQFEPVVADALLYAVMHEDISKQRVTAEFVTQTINDRPSVEIDSDPMRWYGSLPSNNGTHRPRKHASLTDMCRALHKPFRQAECLARTQHVASYPLQCIAVDDRNMPARSVGQFRDTNWRNIMARVDWVWACSLAVILLLLRRFRVGEKEVSQHWNVLLYLSLVAVYKWQSSGNDGLLSPDSLWTTIVQSFHVFAVVHPIHDHLIAILHFATYWFEIAAWRAKTLQNMLGWYLLYELVASFVNEYSHHEEADDGVRCMRVLFIHTMKQYAVNDVIRAYLCAPVLVYGYLLPMFIASHVLWSVVIGIALWCVWSCCRYYSKPVRQHLLQPSRD
jgi:hypothetical protein